MLPPDLRQQMKGVRARLASSMSAIRTDGGVGPEPANPDGTDAIRLLDDVTSYIDRLQDRLEHEPTCTANDMDPLDDAPYTCGLRDLIDPWGRNNRMRDVSPGDLMIAADKT